MSAGGRNTPEYNKLRQSNANLRRAIVDHLNILCDDLVDNGLINDDQKRSFKNKMHDAGERASDLVSVLLNQVEQNSQNFYTLIKVLEKDKVTYRTILNELYLSKPPLSGSQEHSHPEAGGE